MDAKATRKYKSKSARLSGPNPPSVLQDQYRTISTTSISRWRMTGSGSLLSGTAKPSYTSHLYRTAIQQKRGKTLKRKRKTSLARGKFRDEITASPGVQRQSCAGRTQQLGPTCGPCRSSPCRWPAPCSGKCPPGRSCTSGH